MRSCLVPWCMPILASLLCVSCSQDVRLVDPNFEVNYSVVNYFSAQDLLQVEVIRLDGEWFPAGAGEEIVLIIDLPGSGRVDVVTSVTSGSSAGFASRFDDFGGEAALGGEMGIYSRDYTLTPELIGFLGRFEPPSEIVTALLGE